MTQWLLLCSWLVPLLAAPFGLMRTGRWLVVLATLPSMAMILLVSPGTTEHIPWLFLGMYLGIDYLNFWLTVTSIIIWFAGSIFTALQHLPRRFNVFYVLAMAGNILLLIALDMATFYLGFALMGLATAGLIFSQQSEKKTLGTYLRWTIIGELAIFSALIMLAPHSNDLRFDSISINNVSAWVLILIVFGFGIKLAIPGLHLWMPVTYANLPNAAAAVVSGPMISVGIFGLLRFMSPANIDHAFIGQILIGSGLLAMFYAVIIGLMQSNVKVALGYSSMSKMGILITAIGIALIHPGNDPLLVSAIILFTIHHLLIKSSLFLSLDLAQTIGQSMLFVIGVTILVASLIGLPYTSGAFAKAQLTTLIPAKFNDIHIVLGVAAFLSSLLMARILYIMLKHTNQAWISNLLGTYVWWLLVIGVLMWPFSLGHTPFLWKDIIAAAPAIIIAVWIWKTKPNCLLGYVTKSMHRDPLEVIYSVINNTFGAVFKASTTAISCLANNSQQALLLLIDRFKLCHIKIARQSISWRAAGAIWVLMGVVIFASMTIGHYHDGLGEKP